MRRRIKRPKYPHFDGKVSAKVMNRAEIDETFAGTVREAIKRHVGRYSSYKPDPKADTLMTMTVGTETVTIMADESQFFRELGFCQPGGQGV